MAAAAAATLQQSLHLDAVLVSHGLTTMHPKLPRIRIATRLYIVTLAFVRDLVSYRTGSVHSPVGELKKTLWGRSIFFLPSILPSRPSSQLTSIRHSPLPVSLLSYLQLPSATIVLRYYSQPLPSLLSPDLILFTSLALPNNH